MNGKRRLLPAISFLALIVAAILAWIAHSRVGVSRPVSVGPLAKNVSPADLSIYRTDTVDWTLNDTTGHTDPVRTLYIEFERQEVFPKSKPVPGTNPVRYRIPCVGPYCLSGPVGPNAALNTPYKYWQVVIDGIGNADNADGRIIIKQGP